MIDLSADHISYVLASYGVAGFVLSALVVVAVRRARHLAAELKARGLSDPGEQDPRA